jgi:cob(I)alamin adenosyltransferase
LCQEKIRSGLYDLVVLDEINYCCGYNWLTGQEVAEFIKNEKPAWMHLVLTGRNAPAEVIEVANTVTEMQLIKHAYQQGIKAEQGVEF